MPLSMGTQPGRSAGGGAAAAGRKKNCNCKHVLEEETGTGSCLCVWQVVQTLVGSCISEMFMFFSYKNTKISNIVVLYQLVATTVLFIMPTGLGHFFYESFSVNPCHVYPLVLSKAEFPACISI